MDISEVIQNRLYLAKTMDDLTSVESKIETIYSSAHRISKVQYDALKSVVSTLKVRLAQGG